MENSPFEIQFNQVAKDYLKESAKWSYFLSIIGFIGIGFMVVAAIVMLVASSALAMESTGMPFPTIWLSFLYVLLAVLYFFPVYYLFKYATKIQESIRNNTESALTEGLGYLKSHHKFMGIMTIVIMSLYLIFILFMIFGMSSLMR